MNIYTPLFEGEHVRLGPIDHEKDAEVESRWTHDAEFMRLMYLEPARPFSPWQIKKKYEALEKSIEEEKNLFHFRIRARKDDRLIGLAEIYFISWTNAVGSIRLGIGAAEDRRRGYGSETLRLLLRYAFAELNLYRLTALIPEYNTGALALFRAAGFVEEVCRRQALARAQQRWALFHYGLLSEEWQRRAI